MPEQNSPEKHTPHTKNKPGVPIIRGVNTPFIKNGPPANQPVKKNEAAAAPASPTPAK